MQCTGVQELGDEGVVTAVVGMTEVELRRGLAIEERGEAIVQLALRDGCFRYLLSSSVDPLPACTFP